MKKSLILLFMGCLMVTLMAPVCGAVAPTNMVLDYDSTQVDSNLRPGDSGILRVVIKNTGGEKAEKVSVWIPDVTGIYISKQVYIGTIMPGEAITISTLLEVAEDAKIGLNSLTVQVRYTGYDGTGKKEEHQERILEIPIRIYGNLNFQVNPTQTIFFKDVPGDLILECSAKNHIRTIRDVSLVLSSESDCITVFGSTKKYIGELNENQNFTINYKINPNSLGMCEASVSLSYTDLSGNSATDNMTFGLSIRDPDVNFKVIGMNYTQLSPGDTTTLILQLKNVGSESANDVTVSLDLNDPFIPVQTSEEYIDEFGGGEIKEMGFKFSVSANAETNSYKIPLEIEYKIGGMTYEIEKSIGVDVSGEVRLEVISVEVKRDKLQIEVANVGTRTAYAVKAILNTSDASNPDNPGNTETEMAYKDDIDPNKPTTFSFRVPKAKTGELILEYTGVNNKRITVKESIDMPGTMIIGSMGDVGSGGGFPLWGVAIIVIIIVVVMYKLKDQF